MKNIEFVYPEVFYFLIAFLVLWFLILVWNKIKKRKTALKFPYTDLLKKAEKEISFWKRKKYLIWLKWIFFLATVILLSISLARPQKISSDYKVSKNGVDILIALDISESMLAQDLKPNRIEAAKKYISNFVSKLKNDRVGLEIFAGKPFTQSPMSFDYNVVKYYLSEISTKNINQRIRGLNGTAIGDAILAAINRFKNDPGRTKVLILLTDGEANVGVDPILATEEARANGIKIYTIGIGKKDSPLPIGKRNGQIIYARNPDGSLYLSSFDEKTLKNIAQISGGEYFWAGDNKALEKSLDKISKLEKKEYKADTVIKKKDLFWPWLFSGFLLATLSILFLIFTEIKINFNNIKKKTYEFLRNR